MLKEYSISDILGLPAQYTPYYVGTFEDTEDPDIEWPHRHSFYSFVWFTKGSGFYVVDFQEIEIKPQRLFLVNAKQIHNWEYSSNSEGYVLMFDSILGRQLGITSLPSFTDIPSFYIPTMESCFSYLINESDLKDNLSEDNIKSGIQYLYSIIKRLTQQSQVATSQHNSVMDRLRLLVLEKESKQLSVEQYAISLHVSSEELNRICKDSTGMSTKQYIMELKITEAKRFLLFSDLNINEISFHLGFEDPSYFSRIFKKKVSLTPSEFLEKYQEQG